MTGKPSPSEYIRTKAHELNYPLHAVARMAKVRHTSLYELIDEPFRGFTPAYLRILTSLQITEQDFFTHVDYKTRPEIGITVLHNVVKPPVPMTLESFYRWKLAQKGWSILDLCRATGIRKNWLYKRFRGEINNELRNSDIVFRALQTNVQEYTDCCFPLLKTTKNLSVPTKTKGDNDKMCKNRVTSSQFMKNIIDKSGKTVHEIACEAGCSTQSILNYRKKDSTTVTLFMANAIRACGVTLNTYYANVTHDPDEIARAQNLRETAVKPIFTADIPAPVETAPIKSELHLVTQQNNELALTAPDTLLQMAGVYAQAAHYLRLAAALNANPQAQLKAA